MFRQQGRNTGGISLRKSLEDQGVTEETSMRCHINLVYETLKINPRLDILRYRVSPNTPNSTVPLMG